MSCYKLGKKNPKVVMPLLLNSDRLFPKDFHKPDENEVCILYYSLIIEMICLVMRSPETCNIKIKNKIRDNRPNLIRYFIPLAEMGSPVPTNFFIYFEFGRKNSTHLMKAEPVRSDKSPSYFLLFNAKELTFSQELPFRF
jgi:hypothetical protein